MFSAASVCLSVRLSVRLFVNTITSERLNDCLEGKRENYQVCSVQYCVQQLCTVHTHMNRPNRSLDWVLSHWAHFTVLRFIFVYICMYFLCDCILYECLVIVTW